MTTEHEAPRCPRCGSQHVMAGDRGVSAGRSAAGWLLLGGIGLFAGAPGRKAVLLGCMTCGHRWEPRLTETSGPSLGGCLLAGAMVVTAIAIFAGALGTCADRTPVSRNVVPVAETEEPIPEVAVSALPVAKKRTAPKTSAQPSATVPTMAELLRELGADAY